MARLDFFGGAADLGADDLEVERFLDEVVGAVFHGIDGRVHIAVGGDHDDLRLRGWLRADELEEVEAVGGRVHAEIGDGEVEFLIGEDGV